MNVRETARTQLTLIDCRYLLCPLLALDIFHLLGICVLEPENTGATIRYT
jgi:hypothetical protein